MPRLQSLAGIAILPVVGGLLLMIGGCGNGSYPVDPEGGAKLKQARINAYGPSGVPSGKKGAMTATNAQAAARQKAGGR